MAVAVTGTPVAHSPTTTESPSTVSVTVPAGATKLIVCAGVSSSTLAPTVSGITWNTSSNLTQRGHVNNNNGVQGGTADIWTFDNPSAATANVVISYTGSAIRPACVIFCVTGAGAGISGSQATSTTTTSVSLSTPVNGLSVMMAFTDNESTVTLTVANSQSEQGQAKNTGATTSTKMAAATLAGTGSSITLSYTVSAGSPDIKLGVAIALAASGSAPTFRSRTTDDLGTRAGSRRTFFRDRHLWLPEPAFR